MCRVPARFNRDALYSLLKLLPVCDGFAEAVALVVSIDLNSGGFWNNEHSHNAIRRPAGFCVPNVSSHG